MKTLPLLVLGGLVTSGVWAGPSAQLQDVNGQARVVITQLPLPPAEFDPATLDTGPAKTASLGPAFVISKPPAQAKATPITKATPQAAPATGSALPVPPRPSMPAPDAAPTPAAKSVASVSPSALTGPVFVIDQEVPPMRALRQWLQAERLKRVAWSLSEPAQAALATPMTEQVAFTGSLKEAIAALGKQLDIPLRLDTNTASGVVAIHTLGPRVAIHWVTGDTLQGAVRQLVRDYHWQWVETPAFSSWMAKDDYPFLAPYAVVTPLGAIDHALDFVLDGYPVRADLVGSTQLVLIREN